MANESDLVRVNTRISKTLNAWLDEEASQSGMSKSSIIMMATENYRREKVAMERMGDMTVLVERLNSIEQIIKQNESK